MMLGSGFRGGLNMNQMMEIGEKEEELINATRKT